MYFLLIFICHAVKSTTLMKNKDEQRMKSSIKNLFSKCYQICSSPERTLHDSLEKMLPDDYVTVLFTIAV